MCFCIVLHIYTCVHVCIYITYSTTRYLFTRYLFLGSSSLCVSWSVEYILCILKLSCQNILVESTDMLLPCIHLRPAVIQGQWHYPYKKIMSWEALQTHSCVCPVTSNFSEHIWLYFVLSLKSCLAIHHLWILKARLYFPAQHSSSVFPDKYVSYFNWNCLPDQYLMYSHSICMAFSIYQNRKAVCPAAVCPVNLHTFLKFF